MDIFFCSCLLSYSIHGTLQSRIIVNVIKDPNSRSFQYVITGQIKRCMSQINKNFVSQIIELCEKHHHTFLPV